MRVEIGLVALACTLVAANLQRGAQADSSPDLPKIGAYDPHGLLRNQRDISIEHVFVHWQSFDADEFRSTASKAAGRGRQLMVTVEPWTRAANGLDGRQTLLGEVLSGGFDPQIASVCNAIGAADGPVRVSWGHEMDETEGRFPWANQDPQQYQAAYRYFVDKCRPLAPTARFGWTPKGESNLGSYYPGDAYVDFVGLTLFDLQAWNRDHGDERSFDEKFGGVHKLVAGFGKPIILAEFGVEGDEAYREQSLSCARERLAAFSGVEALVYFNDRETWSWPAPYGRPDWRVNSAGIFRCERKSALLPPTPDAQQSETVGIAADAKKSL